MTTENIVTCVTRLSIADWVYSKTQMLLVTLRSQNQPRVESNVFLEAERSSQLVECARNKRQYPTVPQNQKSFPWMLDCEWMDYLLLICGMWCEKCYVLRTVPKHQPTSQQETGREIPRSIVACGRRHHKRKFFSRRVSVVHL